MNDRNNNSICYSCKNFERYYTKGVKKFNPEPYGWCCVKLENIHAQENCEQFVLKGRTRKSRTFIRIYLSDILTEISELRKLVEADEREDM